MKGIRSFFLRRRVFVIVEQVRILRIEIHRLMKIYDQMMAKNARRFLRDVQRNGSEAMARYEASNPFTGYCRPAGDVMVKINGLEKQVQALFDERREIRLKMAELRGVCQTSSTCAEVRAMLA